MARTIRTFFEQISAANESTIHLDEIESHHLLKVLRLGEGDDVEALNGQGAIYKTKIEKNFTTWEIRRKKIALKEQVAEAKAYLDGQKSKYYDEIKNGSKLTPDQQNAIDFFNRYNKESEEANKVSAKVKSQFLKKTDEVFNDSFKGFEYNVGDKKYRFNVNDAEKIKTTQSDINNFVKMFLNEDNTMSDAKGYHKSLYTAMNADLIAKHFYEQGRADAVKDSVAKSKNVSMEPRQGHSEIKVGGTKFKVLSGDSSNDFKVKMRTKK